jgi:rhamnose transport system permease protein
MRSSVWSRLARWETFLGLMLIAAVLVSSATTSGFSSAFNFSNALSAMAEKSLMVLPLTLIIVARDIDISIASIAGLSGSVLGIALEHHVSAWEAIALALLTGIACGAFNGFFVTAVGLPSLIVTLGTMALFRGLCYVLLGNNVITSLPAYLTNLGNNNVGSTFLPQDILPFLLLAPVFAIVLHRTATGRRIYAIGASPAAARYSGVRSNRIRFVLFVVSGLVCAIAGVILVGRTSEASPDGALGFELDAITIVFLGGVSMLGGKGRLTGVFLAMLLVAALRSVLLLRGAGGYAQGAAVGVVLIVSLVLTNFAGRISVVLQSRRYLLARKGARDSPAPARGGE